MIPVLFKFHSFTIYSYGFFVALGMLVVYCAALLRAEKFSLSRDTVSDLVFLLFVSGVIGARFFYVLQHFDEYQKEFIKIISIQEGGLVWYGGFMVALASGFIYAAAKKIAILRSLDFFAPLVPLGQAVGRIGCFLNGCCFGKFTESSFGVLLSGEAARRLPIQIYESAFLFLLATTFFLMPLRPLKEGQIFVQYVLFYSVGRFLLEFFRGDQLLIFSFTIPQWTSLFLFLAALILGSSLSSGFAAGKEPLYPGFASIRESKAYERFSKRTLCDASKLIYLIDRFADSDIKIVYDEQNYEPAFVGTVARWFFARNYRKQTPKDWIMNWCNVSVITGRLIYVKLPDGRMVLARDVLLDEIEEINQVIRENQNAPTFISASDQKDIPSPTTGSSAVAKLSAAPALKS